MENKSLQRKHVSKSSRDSELKSPMIDWFEACEIAKTAAQEAGRYVAAQRRVYADVGKIDIDRKNQNTSLAAQVVTDIDRQSEKLIRQLLTSFIEKYDVGFLGEEGGDDGSRFEKDYFWCVDPLDGTLAFIEGHAGVSVSIALVSRDGVAVVGVIYDVDTATLYTGILGHGAKRNDELLAITQGQSFTWIQDRSSREHAQFQKTHHIIQQQIASLGKNLSVYENSAGAVMNVCWAVERSASAYFKLPKRSDGGGSVWDYAASACIFSEAGGSVSDVFGKPLELNRRESTFLNHRGVLFYSDANWLSILARLIDE